MSQSHIHHQPVKPADEAQELLRVLHDLPASAQDQVLARLAEVVMAYKWTEDVGPFARLVDSLVETARLHRNPAYQKALTESSDREACAKVPAVDMKDYLRRRRESRHT